MIQSADDEQQDKDSVVSAVFRTERQGASVFMNVNMITAAEHPYITGYLKP